MHAVDTNCTKWRYIVVVKSHYGDTSGIDGNGDKPDQVRSIVIRLIDPYANQQTPLALHGNMERARIFCLSLQKIALQNIFDKAIVEIDKLICRERNSRERRQRRALVCHRLRNQSEKCLTNSSSSWYLRRIEFGSIDIELVVTTASLYLAKKIIDANVQTLIDEYALNEILKKIIDEQLWAAYLKEAIRKLVSMPRYKGEFEVKVNNGSKEYHITFANKKAWERFVEKELMDSEHNADSTGSKDDE